MAEGLLTMSVAELDRSHVVRQAVEDRLSQQEGAERLGIGVRQFKRLVRTWKRDGAAGLVSRQRGQASHNRLADGARVEVVRLLKEKYEDFGPTLAAEKLLELEGIAVSRETVRQLQIGEKLWKPKRRRVRRVFQTRERRPRFGELIQIDGSPHAWFEDRGPRCTLIVFIDDATSRLTALRFVPAETTRAYLETLRDHVLTHGRPLAFYSDRHGIFRVNAKDAESGDGKTEFGRVVERLDIESIHASTPQAKGRVERLFETLQDRLVKELRLAGVTTIEGANEFLIPYLEKHNSQFQFTPKQPVSLFKKVPELFDYQWIFSIRVTRTICKDYTIRFCNRVFLVVAPARTLRGQRVVIRQAINGDLRFETKHRILTVKEVTEKAIDRVKLAQKELKKQLKKPPSQTRAQPEHPKSKKSWMDKFHFGKNSFKQTQHQKKEKIPVEA